MTTAMTVLGKVPVTDLGFILSHEHLVMGDKTDSVWHIDPSEIPGMPPISADDPLTLETLGAVRRSPSILKDNSVMLGKQITPQYISQPTINLRSCCEQRQGLFFTSK
jgi:hypothetical protein